MFTKRTENLPPIVLGDLGQKKAAKWEKPLFFALIILGVVAIGVAGYGAFSFQSGWAAGGFTSLNQIQALSLMAAGVGSGILFGIPGIVGFIKAQKLRPLTPDDLISQLTIDDQCVGSWESGPCQHTVTISVVGEELQADLTAPQIYVLANSINKRKIVGDHSHGDNCVKRTQIDLPTFAEVLSIFHS